MMKEDFELSNLHYGRQRKSFVTENPLLWANALPDWQTEEDNQKCWHSVTKKFHICLLILD